jgi:hypothetical protein
MLQRLYLQGSLDERGVFLETLTSVLMLMAHVVAMCGQLCGQVPQALRTCWSSFRRTELRYVSLSPLKNVT